MLLLKLRPLLLVSLVLLLKGLCAANRHTAPVP